MSASPDPDFSTVEEADAAYYGSTSDDGSGGGGGNDSPGREGWGELQVEPTEWVAGWTLGYQVAQGDEQVRRWFVFRVNPETDAFEALTMSGTAKEFSKDASLEELPHTRDEQEARDAYQTWVENNGGQTGQDGQGGQSSEWGEWTKITQVGDWWIFGREHKNEDRTQYLVASTTSDGTAVYLQPDGSPGPQPHIYDSQEAAQQALDAYAKKKRNGQVPEGQQPTGNAPSKGTINRATGARSGGPLGAVVGAVGGPTNAVLIGAVAAGGLYYAESQGYIDVTEAI